MEKILNAKNTIFLQRYSVGNGRINISKIKAKFYMSDWLFDIFVHFSNQESNIWDWEL